MTEPQATSPLRYPSPFRYPGGKTWLVPCFRQWIRQLPFRPQAVIEPFAGGATISLTSILENLAETAELSEIDDDVAAVWQAVVDGHSLELSKRIMQFKPTPQSVTKELEKEPTSVLDRAFRTIIKNRTFRGGIIAEGSRMMCRGENDRGVASRWYPETIARRFRAIHDARSHIIFRREDGMNAVRRHCSDTDVVFFLDPPYATGGKSAGRRLYSHHEVDHNALLLECRSVRGRFLMTCEDTDEIRSTALACGFQAGKAYIRSAHNRTMKELIVSN